MLNSNYSQFIVSGCLRVDFPKRILRVCEILIDDTVTEVNVTLLEMYDVDVILGMDRLFNHGVSMDCFTKKIVLSK